MANGSLGTKGPLFLEKLGIAGEMALRIAVARVGTSSLELPREIGNQIMPKPYLGQPKGDIHTPVYRHSQAAAEMDVPPDSLSGVYDTHTRQAQIDTDRYRSDLRSDMEQLNTIIESKATHLQGQIHNANRITLEQTIAAELLKQNSRILAKLESQARHAEKQKTDSAITLIHAANIPKYIEDPKG